MYCFRYPGSLFRSWKYDTVKFIYMPAMPVELFKNNHVIGKLLVSTSIVCTLCHIFNAIQLDM